MKGRLEEARLCAGWKSRRASWRRRETSEEEEQAELGWGGAKDKQGPCVHLSSEARKNLQLRIWISVSFIVTFT